MSVQSARKSASKCIATASFMVLMWTRHLWECFTLILFNHFLFFPLFAGLGHCSLKIGNSSGELWKRSNIAAILWSFPPLRSGFFKESPASPGCSPFYTVCFHQAIDVQSQNAGSTDWKTHSSSVGTECWFAFYVFLLSALKGQISCGKIKKISWSWTWTPLRYVDSLCIRIPRDQSRQRSRVIVRSMRLIGTSEDWGCLQRDVSDSSEVGMESIR